MRRFHTLDVFTDRAFGGNPLAVVSDAAGLSPQAMQAIAREFNLSETVFILPPEAPENTRRVRIFTPASELPFAGHPTIGAAWWLALQGEVPVQEPETEIRLEEGVGVVRVRVRVEGGRPVMAHLTPARLPERGPPAPSVDDLSIILGLSQGLIREDELTAEGWSCGLPFLYVPLVDLQALGDVRIDRGMWERVLASAWAPHLYVLVHDGEGVRARMFSPDMGIMEDPATGSAAAALAGYLAARDPRRDGTLRWTVEQGVEMGRPSRIFVEADVSSGAVTSVRVGGTAVLLSEGKLLAEWEGG